MKIEETLIKPVFTEKATGLSRQKVYLFEVNSAANKNQVKEAIIRLFKVKVGEVKMMIRKGKVRKGGKKMVPKKLSDRKIAFVHLTEGKIDLFPES